MTISNDEAFAVGDKLLGYLEKAGYSPADAAIILLNMVGIFTYYQSKDSFQETAKSFSAALAEFGELATSKETMQ